MTTTLLAPAAPLSLAAARESFDVLTATDLLGLGPVLVVAPHPDDESLGVGGLLARLAALGVPAHVLLTSDGSASHPGSRTHPPAALARLREAELGAALDCLGLGATALHQLYLPDGRLPGAAGQPGFRHAVQATARVLAAVRPATLVLPWRRDPHPDHRATWAIVRAATEAAAWRGRWFEYLVWAWERATPEELPRADELRGWRVEVGPFLPQKAAAIRAHVSQTTPLIQDSPDGFTLSAGMLAHFAHPWEVLLEEA